MFHDYHWAYLIGDIVIGFPIWFLLFVWRKDLRREMLIGGVLIAIAGVLSEHWFLLDYWHPEHLDLIQITAGDIGYGFFLGGVASVCYEVFLRKTFRKRIVRKDRRGILFFPIAILAMLIFVLSNKYGNIDSIYSAIAALLCLGSIIICVRRDLFWDGLLSGVFFGLGTTLGYLEFLYLFPGAIRAWWDMTRISGILILGIPVEELAFAFAAGFAVGPAYEFFTGLRFKE